jgi:hypothetical protein
MSATPTMVLSQSKYVKCDQCGDVVIHDSGKPLTACDRPANGRSCLGIRRRLSEWEVVCMLSGS